MVDIRRTHIDVQHERRQHPRLEFHCDCTIRGITGVRKITDISLGGFFFELKTSKRLRMGQTVDVAINLPTEPQALHVKAKFVNQTERGIGCQFVDMTPEKLDAVRKCFDTFKDTLPAY